MSDLTSKRWIVAKGLLFLAIAVSCGLLLWLNAPSFRTAILSGLLAWSSARFYYFLFYVLEKYVDPRLKYAGVWALLRQMARSADSTSNQSAEASTPEQ